MKQKYLKYLIDPVDGSSFDKLIIFKKNSEEIIDGVLCSNKNWYPIVGGIPRILVADQKIEILQRNRKFLERYGKKMPNNVVAEWKMAIKKIKNLSKFEDHQRKTADSFAYEWKNIYKENNFEKQNYLHFIGPFLGEGDLKGKKIVDIGCGSGRFTKWPAMIGAEVVIGVDLGESVEAAYKLTKNFDNVCIVQGDIYNIPVNSIFDIAYSIGVLHHLPKPKEGFLSLLKVLKKGGKMLIWVYSRRNNNRALYFYEPLRAISRKIPKPILYKLCYIPALAVHLINWFTRFFNIKNAIFSYYGNFSFNMKLNDAFDVLATPKSNYYYFEEIEKWFSEAKLKKIKSFEHPEAGITCVGEK